MITGFAPILSSSQAKPAAPSPAVTYRIPLSELVHLLQLDYDAAVPMYINRRYMVEFLHPRVHTAGHSNTLEEFLYIAHRTDEYLAMTRANAIIDLVIARPMRWLTGKSADLIDWSPFSMGPVLDMLEELFERGARDGSVFFDPELNIWKLVADKQPALRENLHHMYVARPKSHYPTAPSRPPTLTVCCTGTTRRK